MVEEEEEEGEEEEEEEEEGEEEEEEATRWTIGRGNHDVKNGGGGEGRIAKSVRLGRNGNPEILLMHPPNTPLYW